MIRTCLGAFAARVFAAMVGGRAFLLALVFVFTAGTEAIAQTMTAPNITSEGPFLVDEGETAVATLTADDSDTATTDLIWTNTGGADSGKFSLTSAGVLTFIAAKDYEAPDDADADRTYEVTVQVSDGTETDSADLVVTLENVVELTAITEPASVEFPENSWSRVATFTASSEEDRAGIEWILGGTDSDHFSIDNPPGALRFALPAVAPRIFSEPPDFEAPVDPDAANTYELTLLAEAGSSVTDTHTFTVTVTDVDEEGALSLSSTRPALGTVLTAVPTDPDGVTAGTALWQWERSTGRNSWAVIDGAAAASYTPVAADTNTFLRVTATYDDQHGTGKTVSEVAPNVVTGLLLTGLTAETDDSQADTARGLYPAFDPQTLHYGIGCNGTDTLVLTVSAPANARVAVAGVQAASAPEVVSVAVTADSDVAIRVTDASGAGTTYVVHCLSNVFFEIETVTYPGTDLLEDLILFNRSGYFTLMDRNGVPRLRRAYSGLGGFAIRFYRIGIDGAYRYGFGNTSSYIILDEDFEVVEDNVRTVAPLTVLNAHDFQILEDGNYLVMSWEPATPDFSDIDLPYLDGADVSSVDVLDSAFQIVTPGGQAVFTWNSWGNMAIEDCVHHRFPVTLSTDPDMRSPGGGYAHINGMHVVDGVLVASMRGCSKVLGIDVKPGVTRGDVLWRMGRTNLSDSEWAARDIGPRPLDFINDPEGEFCGQHTARFLPNGNVFLFDNGVLCAIDPWTFEELGREGYDFSRAVEYALDLDNHEAVFVRDHSLRGERSHIGYANGNVDVLDNGDWLVSWGRVLAADDRFPDNEMATLVDPATGQEKLGLRFRELPSDARQRRITATVAPAEALAPQPVPLTAEFPASDHTSLVHTGSGDAPQVIVAFNQPVVDFSASSPSISVQGATIESVLSHIVAGEPANAYVVTLTPTGVGPITFGLVADPPCASGGICTAGGTLLSEVPASHVIRADTTPPTVSNIEVSSDPGTDRTYAAGDEIRVTVTFSETVFVTGMPQLRLELGGGDRTADYEGGSGTAALVFAYTVADGESDTDGMGIEVDSLSGGTIRDEARNNAELNHDGLAADAGHKVDGVRPRLAASGGAVVDGTTLTLTYDEALDGGSRPAPGDFTVQVDGSGRSVSGVSVSGRVVTLTLASVVAHDETVTVSYSPGANPIRDAAGNGAIGLSNEPVANETPETALPNMWLNPTKSDPVASVRSEATYTVTFQGAWNTTVTAGGVPSGGHFTTLIGGVHNAEVTFLKEGGMATAGVEIMAELGGTGTLTNEVRAAEPNALSVLQGSAGNIGPTGSSTINMVTLTTDHPRVTLLSMVAPSPDWFVGVSGLSLLDAGADWLPSQTVNLYPWDAGTEEGTEFSLTNSATSPQEIITSLRGIGKFSNERIATLTFTRQSVNTAPSFTGDTRFEADENQTAAGRVAAADPDSGDGVTYAITGGADASKFGIGETTGVLTFQVPPNYERAADVASADPVNGAGNNEYIVTVTATGGTGDRAMTTEQTITATVRNVEEAGTISFSQVGSAIRARLSDPDGGVNGATWQWARSSNRNTGWTHIGGATSARYTPSSGDQGMYLQATVSYDDAHSSGKQAQGISATQIAPPNLRVATLVSGLSIPWDIAFTPDGTMLFTQRAGVLSSRLADGTVQTIDADFGDLFASGETGLMGIVVDPAFVSNRRFYTCQGHTGPEIQVIAWTLNAAYTQATRVADPLVGGLPASSDRHGGCRLRFGPEGYLWIATGDAASGTLPQDLTSLGGKVLRVDASTGAGAPTNPFAPSRVYTYGHRNVQGLALRPGTSQMWSVEHGPSVDDEINRLVAGRNYGWNPVPGYNESVPMTDLVEYPDAVEAKWSSGSTTRATSGGIFLEGNQWGVWEGRLAVATLADSKLRLFEFTPDGAFVSQLIVPELNGVFGRLRTPMMGPDGALYVSTSNGGSSDRILRIAEDDPIPVTLKLTPASIGENGGVSTVTASQNRVSITATTVTVSAMAVNPAVPGDVRLSVNKTLTITAGQTSSSGTVTLTANNNTADTPNKTVRVSGTATNSAGVTGPSDVTLTIIDDDDPPTVTLDLMPTSIGENGGSTTVTARLNRTSSETTTVTVSATAVSPAVAGDFALSAHKTLTITAGQTTSAGTVTITANNNDADTPNKTVRVHGTADNSHGVTVPDDEELTITDDDAAPVMTLEVNPTVIAEAAGNSTVTVRINNGVAFAEDQQIALTFTGTASKGTDYTVGLERLTLIAGQSSTATTVTAVDDALDDEAETVRVTARHRGGVLGAEQTITITDDDASPVILTNSTILVDENETAVATLTASDADRPAEDLTWRITGGADRNRFRLTSDGVLTFAAAQDYEVPGDSDGNGDYEVAVEVRDGANPVEAVFTIRLKDVDDTAPVLSSASVNGASLTLTYGEALDPNSRPAASDFTVAGGNSARTVSNVAVSGRAVTLTLDPAVEHGETGIRVSYTPGTNPIQDAAGNDALGLSNERVTNNTGDTTAPTVSRVETTSRPERAATYAAGQEIAVTVTFSETVVVTGTPRLRLNVGGVSRTAAYRSGTGAAAVFVYVVADGESDTDGVSIEANSLTLNGGRIRDGANNNALLTHDGLAANAGHKVDGVKPALAANGGAVVNGTTLTLTFGERLDGSSTPQASAFTVTGGDTSRTVTDVALSGSAVLLTVDPAVEHGETGIRVSYTVPTGTGSIPLQDVLGNDADRLSNVPVTNETPDTTSPTVSKLEITSDPGTDRTYAAGDEIRVTVTFSEPVDVERTPRLMLKVGDRNRPAGYLEGTGTTELVFGYEVADGDEDTDGVSVEAGRLTLNGGTIRDGSNNNAVLDHDGLAANSGHKVDGAGPDLAETGGAVVNGTTLTLTYDEALDGGSRPVSGDFTVSGGDRVRAVTGVRVNGSGVELTLDVGAEHGEAGILVSYTVPTGMGANPIRDVPGNDAEALSRESVTNETPDTTSPEVSILAISSNPGSDRTYAAGDEIEVTVTFSETVEVEGTPQIEAESREQDPNGRLPERHGYGGAGVRLRGSRWGRGHRRGEHRGEPDLPLNGGTIRRRSQTIRRSWTTRRCAAKAGHKVDGVRPAFVSAAVDGASLDADLRGSTRRKGRGPRRGTSRCRWTAPGEAFRESRSAGA